MACEYGEETDFQSFWQDVIDKVTHTTSLTTLQATSQSTDHTTSQSTDHTTSQSTSQATSQVATQSTSQAASQPSAQPGSQSSSTADRSQRTSGQQEPFKLIDVYKFAAVLNAIQVIEKVS